MKAVPSITERQGTQADIAPSKKRMSLALLCLICTSTAFTFGLIYYWYVYSLSHITTDDAYVDADLSPINSRMMGFVSKVLATEAQEVHVGDLLVQLDDS